MALAGLFSPGWLLTNFLLLSFKGKVSCSPGYLELNHVIKGSLELLIPASPTEHQDYRCAPL